MDRGGLHPAVDGQGLVKGLVEGYILQWMDKVWVKGVGEGYILQWMDKAW